LPKKIVNLCETALESGIIGLKGNCSRLQKVAVAAFEDNSSVNTEVENNDKRNVRREVSAVSLSLDDVPAHWRQVVQIIRVKRSGIRYSKTSNNRKKKAQKKQKTTTKTPKTPKTPKPLLKKNGQPRCANAVEFCETAYYAVIKTPITIADAIRVTRGHWNIENKLHRTKDVIFNEDGNKIVDKNAAFNMSQVLNFSLNLLQIHGYSSVLFAVEDLANDISTLHAMITSTKGYRKNNNVQQN
jgi:hypothetical protein